MGRIKFKNIKEVKEGLKNKRLIIEKDNFWKIFIKLKDKKED